LDYSTLNGVTNLDLTYDHIGNITYKSDVGNYTYPASGPSSIRPHAVSSAGSNNYTYDANGNMITRPGATVTWYSDNSVKKITQGSLTSEFWYNPTGARFKQQAMYSTGTETTYYIGGVMEKVVTASGTAYRHYIAAGSNSVIHTRWSNGTHQTYYATTDHLGSSSAVTDHTGALMVSESFDAFGKRRGSNWSGAPSGQDQQAIANITRQGYTGHEHLDNLGLIHMNGRVQDPTLGRFVSADPIIQEPEFSQSLNRYSYVWNNPFNKTDPTGFEGCQAGYYAAGYENCQHYDPKSACNTLIASCEKIILHEDEDVLTPARRNLAEYRITRAINELLASGGNSDELSAAQVSSGIRAGIAACNSAISGGAVSPSGSCISDKIINQVQSRGQSQLNRPDRAYQDYLGKNVFVLPNGKIVINLTITYTGNQGRAEKAANNIVTVFRKAGIAVNLLKSGSGTPDLVIHGASLADIVAAGLACTCSGAANIGGYGRFNDNILGVNVYSNQNIRLNDAHEFAHKLGLRHRPNGITSTPAEPITPNDIDRIRDLYDLFN
jgi:RHS repeat-associated protein